MRKAQSIVKALLAVSAGLYAGQSHAQSAATQGKPLADPPAQTHAAQHKKPGDPPAQSGAAGQLKEVIVTAQRRRQNLLNVPISLALISEQQIQDSGMHGSSDYVRMTPDVFFTQEDQQGRDNGDVEIRGNSDLVAGEDDRDIASKPVVGWYMDGVSVDDIVSGSPNPQLLDVQSIEILRGPQSLYFGRAAEGGTINIVMNEPQDSNSATFQAGGGNYGYEDFGGILNQVLTDHLYFRGDVEWNKDNGYTTNLAPGGAQPNFSSLNGRAAFRWVPGNWDVQFVSQIMQTSGGTFGGLPTGVNPWAPGDYGNGGEFTYASTCGLGSGILVNANGTGNTQYFCQGGPAYNDTSDLISHITAKYSTADYTFVSTTSQLTSTYHELLDDENGESQLFARYNRYDSSTWAQEFKVSSNGRHFVDWTADLYGYDNDKHLRNEIISGPGVVPYLAFLTVPGDEPNANSITNRWQGWSAFFDTTWHLAKSFSFLAGARYSMDQQKQFWTDTTSSFLCATRQVVGGVVPPLQAGCELLDPGAIPGAIYTDASGDQWANGGTAVQNLWTEGSARTSIVTPRVSLIWRPSDSQSVYLTYSKGYNPAGVLINTDNDTLGQELGTTPAPDNRSFYKPETTDNFEIGWHAYLDDHRMLASGDVFLENMHNKQFVDDYFLCPTATGALVNQSLPAANVPGGTNSCLAANGQPYGGFNSEEAIDNANLARSQGVEGSLAARLGEHFDAQFAAAFLDARFIDFTNAPAGVGPQNGPNSSNLNGFELPNSPRWSASASLGTHWPIGSAYWFGNLHVNYTDSSMLTFSTYSYNPANPREWPYWTHALTLVNLDAGVGFAGNRVTLSVKNLLNTFYINGYGFPISVTGWVVQKNPRLIQLTWRHDFSGT
jgi:outer membrane receptor protein involved in Fe transport